MDHNWENIPVSNRLDDVIKDSLQELKQQQKKSKKKIWIKAGSVAAAFAVVFCMLLANPVFASNIPIIGGIFAKISNVSHYKGDYEKNATQLEEEEYTQTSNGITIKISEVYYNNLALYLGVEINNKEGFPAEFTRRNNMKDYYSTACDCLGVTVNTAVEGDSFLIPSPWIIEGKYSDDMKTFEGIIRVDLSHVKGTIPDQFQYDFNITRIGNRETRQMYQGEWNYKLDVQLDTSKNEEFNIHESNENGIGIDKITLTPYEVTASMILPEGSNLVDYFLVICDANGDLMETQGSSEVYSTYGRDISTMYIFVCDDLQYLDEWKGYYYSTDYQVNKQNKTFAQYLQDKAWYSTAIKNN